MAKAKAAPPPPPPEDEEEHECPKCPPVGAPAWMATFADMATLLMAFFVLILSFAEFNQPKFKMIAGSLKEAFGVQRLVPVVEMPKGTTVITMQFSPSPEMSVTKNPTQDTTDTERKEIDTVEPKDETTEDNRKDADEAQEQLVATLQEALENTSLAVETDGESIVIKFPEMPSDTPAEALSQALAAAGQAIAEADIENVEQVTLGGLTKQLEALAQATDPANGANGGTTGDANGSGSNAERRAAIADAKLQVALQQQIEQGLVTVETEDDKVFVTVGAGGAFPSGSADLTFEAQDIMNRLAMAAAGSDSEITVTGHTDDVPLGGGQFRDNWGLAAGRASAVVRALADSGLISDDRMTAVSKGEAMPVADNATAEGREQNRRIEIEINFGDQ